MSASVQADEDDAKATEATENFQRLKEFMVHSGLLMELRPDGGPARPPRNPRDRSRQAQERPESKEKEKEDDVIFALDPVRALHCT